VEQRADRRSGQPAQDGQTLNVRTGQSGSAARPSAAIADALPTP
jgi:hypothetical protein